MSYYIQSNFIAGLPKNPYRGGVGAYEGVVCHATDNYNDIALNERNFESTNWNNAFVHFFVDDTTIIQVADTNYLAWGCGSVGNQRYVQIELCQSQDANKFKQAYDRYVWLISKILHDKGLGVTDGKTIVSHDWVTKNLGGTTHSDPIDYLASHGVSWSQHIENVKEVYNQMDAKPIYFYTGGYFGQSIVNIHGFLDTKKWWFQPSRGGDGSLFFLVGAFGEGTAEAEVMESFLKQNNYWYEKRVGS